VTGVAAAKPLLPACEALTVQLPVVTSVTLTPPTVQMDVVVEEKVTASPEDAVALRTNGLVPNVWSEGPANAIVWLPGATAKVSLTGGAAA
jgi:hypothetical protein